MITFVSLFMAIICQGMYFSPIISFTALWLIGACAFCVLAVAAYYFFRVRTVINYRRRADSERPDKPDADYLPASVIIYSQGDAENLRELLETVLNQDYPAAYEVIVVNEGEAGDVRDTVGMLRNRYPNLYLTFTPEGVVNLSRKKLALTLGIKAARYDVAVLTTSAAIVPSKYWLRRMTRRFDQNSPVEVVLGFAAVDPEEDTHAGCRRRAFDYVAESVRWLGVAVAGKPFRGTEYNIAYRRSLFLRNKGFARSLNLHYGDDDIFISEIARKTNTEVELSEDSIVYLRQGNHPRLFNERVLRRIFTERFIRRKPRILMPLACMLQIVAIATGCAAAVIDWPNLQVTAIVAVIFIAMIALDIATWHKAMKAMKSRPLLITVPWFVLTYPVRRAVARLHSRLSKQKKYTWD